MHSLTVALSKMVMLLLQLWEVHLARQEQTNTTITAGQRAVSKGQKAVPKGQKAVPEGQKKENKAQQRLKQG